MQRNYLELRKFLEDTYPGQIGHISAEQYPPPRMGVLAMQAAGLAQVACVALLLGGDKVFQLLGTPTPDWYAAVAENKMMTFGAVWMANNVAAQMVATGAFEIVVDGAVAYSKLETGRLPSAGDIVKGMASVGIEAENARRYIAEDEF